jgi:hypothetical protein
VVIWETGSNDFGIGIGVDAAIDDVVAIGNAIWGSAWTVAVTGITASSVDREVVLDEVE